MSLPGRLPLIALLLVLVVGALIYISPEFILGVGAVWNLLLFIAVPGTLLWFVYWIYLRRVFRARRIALAHMKRLLREAAERDAQIT